MAKYNITVKANSDSHCNGTRFTKDIPFPSTVINGNMEHSYFKITLKQVNNVTVYMVRSDKVSEFFNNKIDYLSGDCSITVKGRFPTHKCSRKWFVISPTEKKYEKD